MVCTLLSGGICVCFVAFGSSSLVLLALVRVLASSSVRDGDGGWGSALCVLVLGRRSG